ncbi:hypothetical protein [Aestuariispira insulae]|nr:hypothetical protein [Aestuariispira insulae]
MERKRGRPKGARNKVTAAMRSAARNHSSEALETLLALMRGGDKRVSLSAAQEILNRAWGRPGPLAEPVEGMEEGMADRLSILSDGALDERIRRLLDETGFDPAVGRKEKEDPAAAD